MALDMNNNDKVAYGSDSEFDNMQDALNMASGQQSQRHFVSTFFSADNQSVSEPGHLLNVTDRQDGPPAAITI